MVTTETDIWDKVNALERYDRPKYLKQIESLTREEKLTIFKDWRLYRRAFLWVVEKLPNGVTRLARFHPRDWQATYETTRGLNEVALKGRKVGFSTDLLLEMYAKAVTRLHQRAAIISHEEDATKRLLEILKRAHEYNPMKPATNKNNTTGIGFSQTKSTIYIGTAGARVFGRGDDLNLLHLSEAAHFYKKVVDAPNFMAGLVEAVAKGGRIVLESTPNGVDPIFHRTWQSAKSGELWKPIFLAFYDDKNNDWDSDHPLVLPSTRRDDFQLTSYEQAIVNAHNLSIGNIRFLRYEKQRLQDRSSENPDEQGIVGDEKMVLQEYPVDDMTCFLISEDTVFDQNVVRRLRQLVRPVFRTEQNNTLRIWEGPLTGHAYVVGVDPSEGLPQSNWQAAVVLDVDHLKIVATLRMKADIPELTRRIVAMAYQYNNALLMIERNNHGHSVLQMTADSGYANLYYHAERSYLTRSSEGRWGWPTRADTKPTMIADFKEILEAGALEIHDTDLLAEIAAYRHYDPRLLSHHTKDAYRAPSGGTDDLLMAAMIALQGRMFASSGEQAKVIHYSSLLGGYAGGGFN